MAGSLQFPHVLTGDLCASRVFAQAVSGVDGQPGEDVGEDVGGGRCLLVDDVGVDVQGDRRVGMAAARRNEDAPRGSKTIYEVSPQRA
jgi:hypothetical protein